LLAGRHPRNAVTEDMPRARGIISTSHQHPEMSRRCRALAAFPTAHGVRPMSSLAALHRVLEKFSNILEKFSNILESELIKN